jgi:aspartate oxidase
MSSAVERAHRRAVERRLATTIPVVVAAEASAILSRLKSMMWEDVGVIRSRVGLERAVSELSAVIDEAEGLWEEAARGSDGGGGGGRRWRCATRRAPALTNRISGGCHYVVPASSEGEEEDGARSGGGPTKEQDNDDDDDNDDSMVVARA